MYLVLIHTAVMDLRLLCHPVNGGRGKRAPASRAPYPRGRGPPLAARERDGQARPLLSSGPGILRPAGYGPVFFFFLRQRPLNLGRWISDPTV